MRLNLFNCIRYFVVVLCSKTSLKAVRLKYYYHVSLAYQLYVYYTNYTLKSW